MIIYKKVNLRGARIIYMIFIFSAIISFLYAVFKGRYNGDFLGTQVSLSFANLLLNLILNILPFLLLWKIYKFYKRKPIIYTIPIPVNFFYKFLILLFIWYAFVTYFYGVGIMGAPAYEAPSTLKPIIQILNRINFNYGCFILILALPKKDRREIILVVLLLILAYLRAGLGIILYLIMVFSIKYYIDINKIIKKWISIILIAILSLPTIITTLYNIRDELRGGSVNNEIIDPISGVLIGRLSSFSDSAMILQEYSFFSKKSHFLHPFYFQLQSLGGVFNVNLIPQNRPEQLLVRYADDNSEGLISFMAGTNGNLYFSYMISPYILILNTFNILLFIFLTFFFTRKLNFAYSNEFALMLLLYVTLSGVANEYSFLVFSTFVYFLLFSFFKAFKK